MNQLKSVFIGVYVTIAVAIMAYATVRLYATRDLLAWGGPLLTVVPFLLFLSRAMIFKTVARTSPRLPGIGALAVAGVALALYAGSGRGEGVAPLPLILATLGAVQLGLYSFWYSTLERPPTPALALGRHLPDLHLEAGSGQPFRTSSLRGQPVLIFFYRGNWCPLCMAQVKEVAARYREIAEAGARVVLVSPQPHDNTADLAKRFDVPFVFLTDEGNRAARTLGIENENGLPMGMTVLGYDVDTVLPTVIVLDAEGVIRWVDQTDNYRVRPEPDTFLPILRQLAAKS